MKSKNKVKNIAVKFQYLTKNGILPSQLARIHSNKLRNIGDTLLMPRPKKRLL